MNWRKVLGRGLAALFILVLVAIVAGFFVFRSRSFHRYLLSEIVEKAEQATGGRVELGDFTFRLSGLRADLYRLTVHGSEPQPGAPLLAVDHLAVGLKIIWVFRRKIDLNEIIVDRPAIHLIVDNTGHNNVPQPRTPKNSSQHLNLFDLAIKHFQANHGEIYYNDRSLSLDAELRDLQFQTQFDGLRTGYSGALAYRKGRLQIGTLNPVQHDLAATFRASPSTLNVERLALNTDGSSMSIAGKLNDYSNPKVQATYRGSLATGELKAIFNQAAMPAGIVGTEGSISYAYRTDRPFLESLTVDGRLTSSALAVRLPQARTEVRALDGRYHLENGNFEAKGFRADLLGGHVDVEVLAQHLSTEPVWRVTAAVRDAELGSADTALGVKMLQASRISGRVNGTAEATWRGAMQGLQVRSDATIRASEPVSPAAQSAAIPLDGEIHLRYDGARQEITLSQTSLRMPHTTVLLNGTASSRSDLSITASSADLQEVDRAALPFRTAQAGSTQAPALLGVAGSTSLRAQMQGPMNNPRFAGQFTANNLKLHGTQIQSAGAAFELSFSGLVLRHGDLVTPQQGRISFDGSVALHEWSYTPSSPISAQVSGERLSLADLERLAGFRYPISGILAANISIHGSQIRPMGQGSVRLTQATAYGQAVQSLTLQFEGSGNAVNSTFAVQTPAGGAKGSFTYFPQNQGYRAQFEAANIRLDRLQAARARNMDLAGLLTVSGRGEGTFKTPQLRLAAEIPDLRVREQEIKSMSAQVTVADQRANVTLDSTAAGAHVKARATVVLVGGYDASATFDTDRFDLGPLLASYLPGRVGDLHGQIEAHASLKGPLKDPSRLEAHLQIPSLNVRYQSILVANASPIRLDYRNGVATLERAEIKGTGTNLQVQAAVPFAGPGPINASALGTVNLQIVQMMNPEMDSSGQLKLNVAIRGERMHPAVEGQASITNAAFQAPNAPLGVEKLNGEFAVQNNRVSVTQFTAETGGGTLTAQGFVDYQPTVRFNLGVNAQRVRLRYPEGVRTLLDSDLTLTGTTQSALVSGQVLIDRLSFTNSFDLASFVDQFSGESSVTPGPGLAENVKLNVSVRSTEELAAESSKLSLQGSADLNLRGTAAEPVLLGRATLSSGELFFLGNRYVISNGAINFANPVRTEPVVNLLVTTTVNQYNLSLNFVGPVDRLRTDYTSDPPLPPVDIINLLAFGKTTQQQASGRATPVGLGAESLLAQGLSSQASSRMEKLAGLSHVSIDPLIGGNQTRPGARLEIQQRVTKNLLFTFSTDVSDTQNEIVQVEYQVSRKWSVSVTRDEYGGYSFDARMHKTF
jgi:translocation and assembly module TamB